MTPDQVKRRDELAELRFCDHVWPEHGEKYRIVFKEGYHAGYEDAEVNKAVCCMEMEEQNKELTRKLEVATSALKKAIEFGEYAEWAIEADKKTTKKKC